MKKEIVNKIQYACYSPFVWLEMLINGISHTGISFWNGFPYFLKAKGSSILIGNGCRFASRETSNVLGLSRRCMLSTLSKDASIIIGDGCSFSGTSIACAKSVQLKQNVRCGANVTIMDSDGHSDDYRSGEDSPIIIEDNVWLGTGVIVMKGSKIGRGALVGAGSVVRGVIPPYSIVVGNPPKIVGFSLTPEEVVEYELNNYEETERIPLSTLENNYNKYFISRIKDIKQFTKL